jgi:HTH-type transcriptional regulator/antitoxin HigA
MEQQGLNRKDLEKYIGNQSKVSEVLNHKRPLSLAMIRALHQGLDIPAEVLLQADGTKRTKPKYSRPALLPTKHGKRIPSPVGRRIG